MKVGDSKLIPDGTVLPNGLVKGPGRWCGTSGGYTNHRCRCPRCRAAFAEQQAAGDQRRAASGQIPHGTANGYENYRCKCERCRSAVTEANRRRKEARQQRAQFGGPLDGRVARWA